MAELSNGNTRIAFAASDGLLWTQSATSGSSTGLALRPGSSPAITPDTHGGWIVAAQATDSRLWTIDSAGNQIKTASAMSTSTSPSIAELSNGDFEIAFVAANGELWVQDRSSGDGTGSFVTGSPSIAADNHTGWKVAFQHTSTGTLWTLDSTGRAVDTGDAVAAGTNPVILALQS
ncbi:MAG TPA: hypothetical protein VGN81_31485 [Pseudonocardiaceae bacterium]